MYRYNPDRYARKNPLQLDYKAEDRFEEYAIWKIVTGYSRRRSEEAKQLLKLAQQDANDGAHEQLKTCIDYAVRSQKL